MTGSALNFFLVGITAMVTTLLLVPSIKQLAKVTGAIDAPDERRVHSGHVPRMGGLAMFFGCFLTFLIYLDAASFDQFRGIFLGMVIIVVIGIIDDSKGLDPKLKLLGQVVAACSAMLLSDANIDFLGGVVGTNLPLGLLSAPLTILWIVGITNAINLSDGLDGLAGGISIIAFGCFGFLAWQRADYATFTLCLVLTSSILGFLRYNTHPAEIFMGDTGSLFLGYCLGTLSVTGNFKSLTVMTLVTPVLVLLVPIADTLWAIIRRIREGRSPFSADKKHFHHKLLSRGMNQSQTVSLIYGITALLSVSAVAMANSLSFKFLLIPLMIISLALFFIQVFGILDLARWATEFSNQMESRFPFHTQPFLSKASRRLVQIGSLIYMLCFALILPTAPLNLLFVVATTFVLVFYLSMTRGKNGGQSYLVFSYFFMAAAIVLVLDQQRHINHPLKAVLDVTEPLGFFLLSLGIFGKILVRKTKDIFLSTPLEFFIFLVLVSIAIIPEDLRAQYNLVQNTLRSFFLFLAVKIIALNFGSSKATVVLPSEPHQAVES
ncbi:MAG: MraY family glycosyltransferase [Acidobacteriota bacterium]|nr:MraY family glycosyltransferase [Acidobacteriota bacterium]